MSIAISILALFISGLTAWLTLLRRGTVRMTRPTVIFFGNDAAGHGKPKVFLRGLLYATAKRGRVVQSMHATLVRNGVSQDFNIWVYGDKKLVRGSGLFVGDTGVAANHHFLLPSNAPQFQFDEGVYEFTLIADLVGDQEPITLLTQTLQVTPDLVTALEQQNTGLYFDWEPGLQRYLPHIDKPSPAPNIEEITRLMERHIDDEVE